MNFQTSLSPTSATRPLALRA